MPRPRHTRPVPEYPPAPELGLDAALALLTRLDPALRAPARRQAVEALLGHARKDGAPAGADQRALPALTRFGLLEREWRAHSGRGRALTYRLSALAAALLDEHPGSPAHRAALRGAALTPALYRAVRARFPGALPLELPRVLAAEFGVAPAKAARAAGLLRRALALADRGGSVREGLIREGTADERGGGRPDGDQEEERGWGDGGADRVALEPSTGARAAHPFSRAHAGATAQAHAEATAAETDLVIVRAPSGAEAHLPISWASRLTPARWRALMDVLTGGEGTDPTGES